MSLNKLRVVVGIVLDSSQRVLISQRTAGKHLAGLWEFPGGKIEPKETQLAALAREFKEELNLDVESAHFLFTVDHVYPEKAVALEIFLVDEYRGVANGMEGQSLHWCPIANLGEFSFPEANVDIVKYLQEHYGQRW